MSSALALSAVTLALVAPAGRAADVLGSARLQIAGSQLTVSPASQTVPFETPTVVDTVLEGYDPALGQLPTDLVVVGDFSGPEVEGTLRLETVPNEPFRIPRLRLQGEYVLDNIRLVQAEETLAYAVPRSVSVNVARILLTGVHSRALTAEELASYGLALDPANYQTLDLTFGFGVQGNEFSYNLPIIHSLYGPAVDVGNRESSVFLPMSDDSRRTVRARFTPPRVTPFSLRPRRTEEEELPLNGCDWGDACRETLTDTHPLVGVLMFPTELSLLHQFFSVQLMVQNGAPPGDPLTIRDLMAQIHLPTALRLGQTDPPALVGSPVLVAGAGPDGVTGTGDDTADLAAQARGWAEYLVEGRREGTHVVHFDLDGTLDGLPTGAQPIEGKAQGAVAVRDPRLAVQIAHPEVVRAELEYWLHMTFTNIGTTPVTGLSVSFPSYALSGVAIVGDDVQTIASLNPQDSESIRFRIRPTRTGRILASSVKTGSSVDPSFLYSMEVGKPGSHSPDTLVLPTDTDLLPQDLVSSALALVGLGYSLAQSPPSLASGLPRVGMDTVNERIYRLKQAGIHLAVGEELFDAVAILALEIAGSSDQDWLWDQLVRRTQPGGEMEAAFAAVLDAESASAVDAFNRLAATTHYMGPEGVGPQAVLAVGDSTLELRVSSRTSGKAVERSGLDAGRLRDLPFAQVYDLTGGRMTVLSVPEEGGYRAHLTHPTGGTAELHVLVPDQGGETLRAVRFTGLALAAGAEATLDFQTGQASFALLIDDDGDGVTDQTVDGTVEALAPRPFQAVAARVDALNPSSHRVHVLFAEDIDLESLLPRDSDRFQVPGNTSNGGLLPEESTFVTNLLEGTAEFDNPFEGLSNTRLVQLVFDNPVSHLVENLLTVSDVASVQGDLVTGQTLPIEPSAGAQPASFLTGVVYGADGQGVPNADVVLEQSDLVGTATDAVCAEHDTAAVKTDATGRFFFDFVRRTDCGDVFRIKAEDPTTGFFGSASGRVTRVGDTLELNIVMPHRTTVKGRVTYADGTVPRRLEVVVSNRDFNQGWRAHVDADGFYQVGDVIVGTVTLAAHDFEGNYVYRTLGIDNGEEVVEQDLAIIPRRLDQPGPGRVRGTVSYADGGSVHDAFVALYVNDEAVGVRRTDLDGFFDFALVPSGNAEVEVFDAASLNGSSAAHLFFEVDPDQAVDLDVRVQDVRGSIEGHVYSRSWNGAVTPMPQAVVFIDGTPFNTVTDAAGYYQFEDVFAGDWGVVAVDTERTKSVNGVVSITSGGTPAVRDFYFEEPLPTGGIVGRVFDLTGAPAAGAFIRLAGGYESTRWFHGTVADADGYFALEGLDPGSYGVHAHDGTNGGIGFTEVLYPGHTAQVEVRFRRGKVRVKTLARQADGTDVPVVSRVQYRSVQIVGEWSLVAVERDYTVGFTDPVTGILEFEALMGPYHVYVNNAFHETLDLEGFTSNIYGSLAFNGEIQEHEVVFAENGTIRGVVYDYDGETPAAGATVNLTGGQFSGFDVTTDESGYFELRLVPRGSYKLDALSDDGVVFRTARVSAYMAEAGGEVDVEIVLPEQGSVVGRVETMDGDGVPGAVATLTEGSFPQRRIVQNADVDGYFAFHNIFVGDVMLHAQAPELGGLAGRVFTELSFEAEELVTIVTLEAVGEIIGQLVNPDTGLASPDAEVRLHSGGGGLIEVLNTDTEGRYRFRQLPIRLSYEIRAYDPASGRRGRSPLIQIPEHNDVIEVDTVLEARGGIEGHFIDGETTAPIPASTIELQVFGRLTAFASTDSDGLFRFDGIPAGDFFLYGREPLGRRHVQELGTLETEDETVIVDLVLPATSVVSGQVSGPVGSAWENDLFPNANTRIVQGGVIGAGFDNPFAFEGVLANRSFTVIAMENGGLRRGEAQGRIRQAGDNVSVDVVMQALGSVTVEVFQADGVTPADGVDVVVSNRHDYGRESFRSGTGAGNSLTFGDVRQGRIWARVHDPVADLRGSGVGDLVTDGESVNVQVLLEPTGGVRGRVVLADRVTPAAFANLAVRRGNDWFFGEADEDGVFYLDTIPMGTYTLLVEEADGLGLVERSGTLTVNLQVDDHGTLVLDEEDPRVGAITPVDGAVNQPLSTVVIVVFSEPMDAARSAGGCEVRQATGQNVPLNSQWSADLTTVTLTPTSGAFASGTDYQVTVDREVYDEAGRPMAWPVRVTFQTADVIPPAPIDIVPADGAVQVPVTSDVVVLFSEPLDLGSLSGTAFQLTDLTTGEGVTTTLQLLPNEREVRLTPQIMPEIGRLQALYPDRTMQVTIQGVRDLAGNAMPAPVVTTFWTPDETLPELTWTTPGDGETFTSGDTVHVLIEASDNRGLGRLDLTIGGEWSTSLPGDDLPATSFTWDIPAPVVATTSSVDISAVLVDRFGNQRISTRTIEVQPLANAVAPTVVSSCPISGDLVAPGLEIPIPYAMDDDLSIESFWLEVDGVRLEVVTPHDQPSAGGTYLWTPPAGAVAGQVFDVRLRARDFAGNIGEHVLALSVPSGVLLTGAQTVDASTLAGQSVAIAAGEVVVDGVLDVSGLALLWDGVLSSASTLLDLRVSGRTHVQCGAAMTFDGLGYLGGWSGHPTGFGPDGIAQSAPNSGATHGGFGQPDGGATVGDVYGSIPWPLEAGAGGSNGVRGAPGSTNAGGGTFVLDVAELVVDGEIRARGVSAGAQGGGAGGSGLIVADSLRGVGTIDVNGAERGAIVGGGFTWFPAGGGGRLALHVSDLSGFDVRAQTAAHGGYREAGPGTVYVHTIGSTHGSLYLDAGDVDDPSLVPAVELPALGGGNVVAVAVSADGLDLWVTVDVSLRERWHGAHMELLDAAGTSLGTHVVAELDLADSRVRLEGAAAVVGAATFRGRYLFDEIVFGRGASLIAGDPVNGTTLVIEEESEIDGELAAENLTIAAGAHVRPLAGGTLRFTVSDRMQVQAGAVIEVNGLGYHGGWQGHPDGFGPSGVTTSAAISGASHGGFGQQEGSAGVGETYGSVAWPQLGGGGGGNNTRSTPDNTTNAGGGVLILEVGGELVLEGELQARGLTSGAQGAGAGGSILIDAARLSGGGRIIADGGPRGANIFGNTIYSAGGGGRVALHVDDLTAFDVVGQVQAYGGYEEAGPGTIFVRGAAAPAGDLVIAAQPDIFDVSVVPATVLPTLGGGAVVAADAARSPGDLWVTVDVTLLHRWHGVWMELFDASGQSLGSFEVVERDATTGQVRLADAGGVSDAATFSGLHRFGQVTQSGGGSLAAADQVVVEDMLLTGETAIPSRVEAATVRLASGSRVRPVSGMEMHLRVGTLIVETGAALDAGGAGFAGAHPGHDQGYAPDGVMASSPDAGGSHGGEGRSVQQAGPAGETYDSVYFPLYGGGGGAMGVVGGNGTKLAGGGVIDIVADAVVVDGEILATGLSGGGPGAGGTVSVVATTLSGAGRIDASGGDSNPNCAGIGAEGIGGGGRISLDVGFLDGFDPATQARAVGGAQLVCHSPNGRYAGAGTVFVKTAASTYGDLWVKLDAAGVTDGGQTPLPTIGYGAVGAVTVSTTDATDLWVEPTDPAAIFGVGVTGMWVRVDGTDHRVIGERADRRAVLLDGANGSVQVGDSYLGVYKFDNAYAEGGVHLSLSDHNEVGSWTVDGLSTLTELDVLGPTFDSVTPAEGAVFSSGDTIDVVAAVSDDNGVVEVVFELDGQVYRDTAEPWSWTVRAPGVAAASDLVLTLEAFDAEGGSTTFARTLHVDPIAAGGPPIVSFACPSVVAQHVPGGAFDVVVAASDPAGIGIDRVEIYLDGAAQPDAVLFQQPFTYVWTAPAGAVEGNLLSLRAVARSYAVQTSEISMQVPVVERPLLVDGAILDATFDGQEVFLGAGIHSLAEPVDLAALTLLSGATLAGTGDGAWLSAGGTLTVHCRAAIDVSGLGFAGGTNTPGEAPSGLTASPKHAGGSHGGPGVGSSLGESGEVFDSLVVPSLGGGGGGGFNAGNFGGAGGGVLWIDAASLQLDGELRARGFDQALGGTLVGAGAGGSVSIVATSMSGGGLIDASGGNQWVVESAFADDGNPGGGGRVALDVDTFAGFDPVTQVVARGGTRFEEDGVTVHGYAGAGTLYVFTTGALHGELILEAPADLEVPPTPLPLLGSGAVTATEIAGGDLWVSASDAFRERWLGAWMALDGGALGTFRVIDRDAAGRVLLAGASAAAGATGYAGEYRFDAVTFLGNAGLSAEDPVTSAQIDVTGDTVLAGPLVATDLTIASDATVRPLDDLLELRATGTVTIEAGALLDASGRGYAGGTSNAPGAVPAGVSPAPRSAGGSHGGLGQASNDGLGEVYGSVVQPSWAGAGGGGFNLDNDGGDGGGVIHIEAGAVVLEGELRANGADFGPGYGRIVGAGAGGTIVIEAASLSGGGFVDASGGAQHLVVGGKGRAGGGGRIGLRVDDLSAFDVVTQTQARGGVRTLTEGAAVDASTVDSWAGPGTVHVFRAGSTHGDLYVMQGETFGADVAATPLPAIGSGIVGVATVDTVAPADLWIEPQDAAVTFSFGVVGMRVRIDGVDYRVIGERVDRRGLLLEGAAGAVAVGDAYAGYYFFDAVTVSGGATLEIADFTEVATWTVDVSSTVNRPDQESPVIGAVLPAEGSAFGFNDPITFSADVTDNETVAEVRFTVDGTTFTDTAAPWAWTVNAPSVAISSALVLEIEAEDGVGNLANATRTVQIDPAAPPTVAFVCPGTGVLLAPGTGLDVTVDAGDPHGVTRVELFVGGAPAATLTSEPYTGRVEAPLSSVDGDLVQIRAVATNLAGVSAEATFDVEIVEGQVITADTLIAAADATLDGSSLVVAGGTLNIAGPHTFRHLVVLDGAVLSHPATTSGATERLELSLSEDLYVACGGTIDATGRGYLAGMSYPNAAAEAAGPGVGGTHGGRGGHFTLDPAASGRTYGNLFDPRDPGAGAGDTLGTAGGGVIRIQAVGSAVVDGMVAARGSDCAGAGCGAGGSIRLDGVEVRGLGTIDASGGSASGAEPAGGGGRVALYGTTLGDGLLSRTRVAGGAGATAEAGGAAGTLFVKRDAQSFGELVLDNAGVASTQLTELLAVGSGTLDSVTTDSVTDSSADFRHSLVGVEVAWNGATSQLWAITGHSDHGQTLSLDVASNPLTAAPGDSYEGVYRFDRLVVRGGAQAGTFDLVDLVQPAEVEGGSTWLGSYTPAVTITAPSAGALLSARQAFTVDAAVDDLFGVAEVRVTFDGLTEADGGAPFSWSATAPDVAVATSMPILVEVTDLAGAVYSTSIDVTVEPAAGDPPVVTRNDCPADLDWVAPATPLTFTFSAVDEEEIASYSLLVDGVEVDSVTGLAQASVAGSLAWTVPVDAALGTLYDVRIEVRDNVGNVGVSTLQLTVPSGNLLSGGLSLDATWNGQSLYLGNGTFTVTESLALASLTLIHGAVLVGEAVEDLELTLSGAVTLQCATAIDMSGLGFPRHQTYPGESLPGADSGGSHLGVGGAYSTNPAASTFGSLYRPRQPGGGSQSTNVNLGRAGGGVVRLSAAAVTLAAGSVIRANGGGFDTGNNSYTRGGAGGSVWITVSGTIAGDGTIETLGGSSGPNNRGSGGGGAIAVEYGATAGSVLDNLRAQGGEHVVAGGAGTVYLFGPASTHGDLVVDNGSIVGTRTVLPSLGVGLAQAGSAGAALVTDLGSIPDYFAGHWVEVYDAVTGLLRGTWRVAGVSGATLTLEPGASGPVSVAAGDTWQGVYRFDNLTLKGDLELDSEDPVRVSATQEIAGTVELRAITAHHLVLRSGARITHPPTTDPAAPESLSIELTGDLMLETGAEIDVSGQGFLRHQTYPGEILPGADSGGSHLGVGGTYTTNLPGSTFGSVYRPRESGGGSHSTNVNLGRAGGGVVRLAAVNVTLAAGSAIRANGGGFETGDNSYARGGGGGSVWITVSGTIGGDGTIEARGGTSGPNNRGSGGGGAIAVQYGTTSGSVLGNLRSWGGEHTVTGGAGTVYLLAPTSVYGDLIVDNGSILGGGTILPSLGVGLAQAGSGGAVLVTDLGSVPTYFTGHWVEVYDGATGAFEGTWRIASISDVTLTLEPGTGPPPAVDSGDTWQGVYRFDNLSLVGDLGLESEDPVRVSVTQEVSGTVELRTITAHDLVLRSGTLVTHPPTTDPAAPESLSIELSGDLTLETGAEIDVTGLGFARHKSYPGATLPGADSGGSHIGVGGPYSTNPAGSTFGSVYRPREPGSGSHSTNVNLGRPGGGVVRLSAAGVTLVAGSAIRANGVGYQTGNNNSVRGGAGGSVWITASGTIAGDGTIEARGGTSGPNNRGSGGGGAIAVEYGAVTGTVLDNLLAMGGEHQVTGGAGTVYLFGPAAVNGDLAVDNGGFTGQGADLPPLGGGTALAGTAGSLLVTDLAADIPSYFVGHWVEVTAADATPKGTYRIAAVAGVTATLEAEGAETIDLQPGDLWQGVYRFDLVTVTGGAALTSTDPVYESGLQLNLATSGQGANQ